MPPKMTGKAAKNSKNPTPKSHAAITLPRWPPLRPLVPAEHLRMETLLEDQVIVIRNFFTSTLCKDYVAFLSALPLTTTPVRAKYGDATRVNDRIQFNDPDFAHKLWEDTGLKSLLPSPSVNDENVSSPSKYDCWGGDAIGLNPRIRIYRYTAGQFFAQHCR